MSLSSALSVSPTEAPGEPDCSFNTPVGSNLVGKWLNPGSFDAGSLGALPNTGATGPCHRPARRHHRYRQPGVRGLRGAGELHHSPGDTTPRRMSTWCSRHCSPAWPCVLPRAPWVWLTVFRFFGETLSQSAAGTGDVRALVDRRPTRAPTTPPTSTSSTTRAPTCSTPRARVTSRTPSPDRARRLHDLSRPVSGIDSATPGRDRVPGRTYGAPRSRPGSCARSGQAVPAGFVCHAVRSSAGLSPMISAGSGRPSR